MTSTPGHRGGHRDDYDSQGGGGYHDVIFEENNYFLYLYQN